MPAPDRPEPQRPSRRHWPEIDLLRGIAGAMMISNHAGVSWLSEAAARVGLNEAITFVGSLAPVFFFTVTGLGRGVQAAGRAPKPLSDTVRKACVLLIADAALWLSPALHLGLDFLGFIGLSAVVLELLDRTRRPTTTIAVAAAGCLALRFGLAPLLHLPREDRGFVLIVLHIVLGDFSVPGVSYPLCPWLAYPLFGWLAGRFAVTHGERILARRWRSAGVMAGWSLAGFGFCLILLRRHMLFFRWGTLSFAYFVLGIAALVGGISMVLAAVARLPGATTKALSLPGIASFVLVPVHYGVVEVAQAPLRGLLGQRPGAFPLLLAGLIPAVFWLSKRIDVATRGLVRLGAAAGKTVSGGLLLAAIALLFFRSTADAAGERAVISVIVQLLATGLFVLTGAPKAAGKTAGARPDEPAAAGPVPGT